MNYVRLEKHENSGYTGDLFTGHAYFSGRHLDIRVTRCFGSGSVRKRCDFDIIVTFCKGFEDFCTTKWTSSLDKNGGFWLLSGVQQGKVTRASVKNRNLKMKFVEEFREFFVAEAKDFDAGRANILF